MHPLCSPSGMSTFEYKQAYGSVEDVGPCICVALIVLCFTPRVVQKGYTALMRAINKENEKMVTVLLEHNANPDIQDKVPQDGA